MTLDDVEHAPAPYRLAVMGAAPADRVTDLPDGMSCLVMVGPGGAQFWDHVLTQTEFSDGPWDPLDRCSSHALGDVARDLVAQALFPCGGLPCHPFANWALGTGRAKIFPIELLVHDTVGLFVSYRGSLAFGQDIPLHATGARPCDCYAAQPCRTACPVGANTHRTAAQPAFHM